MPKHAVFECSTVCLPVIFELLPGLIPSTSKWHAGCILDKTVYISTSNSYLTTMYESILHNNTYMNFHLIDCSQKTVAYVEGIIFV